MPDITVSLIDGQLVQVWSCCEHCEHGEVENPYHTDSCCICQGATDDA